MYGLWRLWRLYTRLKILIMFHRFCQLSVSWLVTNDVFYPDFLLTKFARSFNLTLSWFLDHFSFHISIFHTSIFWHFHIFTLPYFDTFIFLFPYFTLLAKFASSFNLSWFWIIFQSQSNFRISCYIIQTLLMCHWTWLIQINYPIFGV